MTGKTHMMIGAAAGITFGMNTSIETTIGVIGAAIFGALLPDIDHPKSKLNQRILFSNNKLTKLITYSLLGVIMYYFDFKLLGLVCVLVGLSTHRGITHSILGYLMFSAIAYKIAAENGLWEVYKGFNIGYITHLIGDFITIKGIKVFWPLDFKIKFPVPIKTDGIVEHFILTASFMYFISIMVTYMNH
ncbi:metal-dependent hydrolase [Clostridiisalibacter paucivorans]|uniref:metal-dependent hydrolase n=1 Tax=Clostridiisalibacter paucivorans TaxID=408753 RepID=UPI000688EB7E|nr:metal-dependent hydrolase [Clostridiisalibacter paucivorans]